MTEEWNDYKTYIGPDGKRNMPRRRQNWSKEQLQKNWVRGQETANDVITIPKTVKQPSLKDLPMDSADKADEQMRESTERRK